MVNKSLLNQKCSHISRSNSSPTEPHPFISQFNHQFCNILHSFEEVSPSLISHKLRELKDVYDHVNDLLQLTFAAKQQSKKVMETLLDVSLRLLDACGVIREVLVQSRECSTQLQSVLRRKCGYSNEVTKGVKLYLKSRREIAKSIGLALKNLKETRAKMRFLDEACKDISMCDVLREVKSITLQVFSSLLLQVYGPKEVLSLSRWFKEVRDGAEENKFKAVDRRLQKLISWKKRKHSCERTVEEVRCKLGEIETETRDVVEALDLLSRNLVKIRVTLLNMYQPLNWQIIL